MAIPGKEFEIFLQIDSRVFIAFPTPSASLLNDSKGRPGVIPLSK